MLFTTICNQATFALKNRQKLNWLVTKTWRVMQLTALFFLTCALSVTARTVSQTITLSAKNMPVEKVFSAIEDQTGYVLLVNKGIFKKSERITVDVKEMKLNKFLSLILSDKYVFDVRNKNIFIKEKDDTATDLSPRLNIPFHPIPPITGKVVGPDGQPIAGANVTVRGTKRGAVTNADGSFSIEAKKSDIIIISSIGFSDREITVNNSNAGVITLELSQSKLDEVHIIAYGTTSKRLSTSGTTGINADDIKTQPISNPLLALAGRTTGVTINQSSGLAGSALTVRVQGQNSIGKGNDPFYVVDGVPFSANLLPTLSDILGGGGDIGIGIAPGSGNPFSFINPNDIESIEILKDADATAIYGSRAANGAILITTKKGSAGRTNIDVTAQTGFGHVANKMKMMNTQQYLMMRKEAYTNDGIPIPDQNLPVDQKYFDNFDLTVWDQNSYTDWQKELIGGTSKYTDIQTGISGGTNQTTFRLNVGYHRETTVFPGDFEDRKMSLGLTLNHSSLNQRFKIQFSASSLNDKNRLPGIDLTRQSLLLSPNAPSLYKADGTLNWEQIEIDPLTHDSISTFDNPLGSYQNNYETKNNNLVSNLNLSYRILKGLTFRTTSGYSLLSSHEYATSKLISIAPEYRSGTLRGGSYGNGEIKNWIIEPQLNYHVSIEQGSFDALIGSTFQQTNSEQQRLSGSGYSSDDATRSILNASTVRVFGGVNSDYKYNAIFGRLNYNLNDTYILNLTARRDGSSRFGRANQFHNFGAIGTAWIFTNERWVKNISRIFSFGKLRGSFGTTGNDQIGDYAFLGLYNIIVGRVYGGSNALQVTRHSNPYLQWEETKKLQIGLDFGFFKDQVLFTVNHFRNRSSNQLLNYELPSITGFGGVTQNFAATLQNSGWEFSLNTINIRHKSFNWTSNFNLTIPKNKLIAYPGLPSNSYQFNQAVNITQIYSYAGLNSQTGLYEFNTADGAVSPNPNFFQDRIRLFTPNPKFYGGLQNTFTYKNFNFTFLLQFVNQKAAGFQLGLSGLAGGNFNVPVALLDRWQKPGDNVKYQKYSTNTYLDAAAFSDFVYGEASYLRLKNLSFSWSFPEMLTKRISIQHVRVFAQGQNLFTFTNYTGLDPENVSSLNLPPLRVITFGIQATF
jgi:TonB-dependent starch-binding outer membrane protein SusC